MTENSSYFTNRFDDLHETAQAATGLSDFGGDEYVEPLTRLLQAYDRTASFDEGGRSGTLQLLTATLSGRLLAEAQLQQLPPAHDAAGLARPIFLVGLPRTGTTALHRLLCQDPAHQGLEYWLGSMPQPRPPRASWDENPAYRAVADGLSQLYAANPRLRAIHEMAADQPDECRLLLMQSFANVTFQSNATIPDYAQWLFGADFSAVYARYRRNLSLIGSNEPERRWVLKDPSHLWATDALLQAFPDACIVQTHRDPVELIPSVASLVFEAKRLSEPDCEPAAVGREQLAQWQAVWEKTLAVRQQADPAHFIDIHFTDLRNDPMGCIERIYDHFGLTLSATACQRMHQWVESSRVAGPAAHRYTPEGFGLTAQGIRDSFAHYRETFGMG